MLMKIIVVGKPKDKVLGAKSAEFVSRCGAYGKVECVELPDSDVAKEGKALMKELEEKIKLRGKDIDLTADDTYSLDEDDDGGDGEDGEDGDEFDIRLLDIENDD